MIYTVLNKIFHPSSNQRDFEHLVLDENFCIVDTSDLVQQFADSPEEVMLGKDIRLSFPEFVGIEDILLKILQGEEELFEYKAIGRSTRDRPDIYIDVYVVGKLNPHTAKKGLIVLIEDVTEKMLSERNIVQRNHEELLLSFSLGLAKEYLESIFNSLADALIVTNHSGRIKKINQAAQNLFGYSEAELMYKPISMIIQEHNRFQELCLLNLNFHNLELLCRNKAGEIFVVSFSCSTVKKKARGFEDLIYIAKSVTPISHSPF